LFRTIKYLVIICPKCGQARYVKSNQKTARCLYCGYRINLDSKKVKVILRTQNRGVAIRAVKIYKIRIKTV